MNLNFLQYIVLYCLIKIDGERTSAAIYHLLTGKRSSQTIQDAHLFKLTKLYKTIPKLSREIFNKEIIELENNNVIVKVGHYKYKLTEEGRHLFINYEKIFSIPKHLDGWQYARIAPQFWERLSLTVQVCSNLVNYHNSYVPINSSSETKVFVKDMLKKHPTSRSEFSQLLYNELLALLSADNNINQALFVIRLTGYNQIGLTNSQAAKTFGLDKLEYVFQFNNILHYLLKTSTNEAQKFPLLAQLSVQNQLPFTKSTGQTYELLNKGHTIEQICTIRNLKLSTIEDHLVEIALLDKQFELHDFVTAETQEEIVQTVERLHTRQLKKIKEQLPKVSYFAIRLTLAKYGD